MNDEQRNRLYREMADGFIDVANRYCEQHDKVLVGSALLYGAARFSAFVAAAAAQDLAQYEADRGAAREYFLQEFRRMLEENLEDYQRVFAEDLKYRHLIKDKPAQ